MCVSAVRAFQPGGPGHSRCDLQEYAGVEGFQGRFHSVQPPDSNCLSGG